MTKAEYQSMKRSLRGDLAEARGAFGNWRSCQSCSDYTTSLYCDEHALAMQGYAEAQNALGNHIRIFRS